MAESRHLNKLRDILMAGAADPVAIRAELDGPHGTAMRQAQVANARRHGMRSELDVAR